MTLKYYDSPQLVKSQVLQSGDFDQPNSVQVSPSIGVAMLLPYNQQHPGDAFKVGLNWLYNQRRKKS